MLRDGTKNKIKLEKRLKINKITTTKKRINNIIIF
jgi:hypothetical protein